MLESRRDFPTASVSNVTLPQQKRQVEFSLVRCDVAVSPTFLHGHPPHPLLSPAPISLLIIHDLAPSFVPAPFLWTTLVVQMQRSGPRVAHFLETCFFFSTSNHSTSLSVQSEHRLASPGHSGGLDAAGATQRLQHSSPCWIRFPTREAAVPGFRVSLRQTRIGFFLGCMPLRVWHN